MAIHIARVASFVNYSPLCYNNGVVALFPTESTDLRTHVDVLREHASGQGQVLPRRRGEGRFESDPSPPVCRRLWDALQGSVRDKPRYRESYICINNALYERSGRPASRADWGDLSVKCLCGLPDGSCWGQCGISEEKSRSWPGGKLCTSGARECETQKRSGMPLWENWNSR